MISLSCPHEAGEPILFNGGRPSLHRLHRLPEAAFGSWDGAVDVEIHESGILQVMHHLAESADLGVAAGFGVLGLAFQDKLDII